MPRLTRRHINAMLLGSAAVAVAPRAMAQATNDFDCVVIGGGLAGITAANQLAYKGRKVLLIEASRRMGGRCYTDTVTLAAPFERGAGWLRSADENPLTQIAAAQGFDVVEDEGDFIVFNNGKEGSQFDYDDLGGQIDIVDQAIQRAGQAKRDEALSYHVKDMEGPWADVARQLVGRLAMGRDLKDISTMDAYDRIVTGLDSLIKGGMGTLVLAYAKNLPTMMDAPVNKITWKSGSVEIEARGTTIRARTCILAVPPIALKDKGITFDPPLPDWKRQAVENLPMGLVNKIGLGFKENLFEVSPGSHVIDIKKGDEPIRYLVSPFDTPMVECLVGGKHAEDLQKGDQEDAVQWALERLSFIFGEEVKQQFSKGAATQWGRHPYIGGSFSVAKPGYHVARATLARSLSGTLFFAGEATAGKWAGQTAGAFLSGKDAAEQVLQRLG